VKEKFILEVHSTTIGYLIKNKDDIGDNPSKKRQRTVLQYQDKIIISDSILIEKAKTFAKMLKIPDSDLKHDLEKIKKHEEDSSVDDNVVAIAISPLRDVLKEYNLKDIYNMDKTLTVALCANADGTNKYKPFVIEFDLKMASHKVILLVDNARCYSSSNLNFYNTTIHYLSPNTTSRIQPLDASIIMSFKCHYKNYFIKWLLDQYKSEKDNKLNVLNTIKFIVQAWKEVLPETICNCFRHTKILPVQNNKELTNDDNDNELIEEMKANIEALNF
ncbi:35126_t:CDS:2, partial [Gigaspora margarita]